MLKIFQAGANKEGGMIGEAIFHDSPLGPRWSRVADLDLLKAARFDDDSIRAQAVGDFCIDLQWLATAIAEGRICADEGKEWEALIREHHREIWREYAARAAM